MNDSLTAEIRAWLRAGAEVTAGLLLFSQFSNNTRFASLVKIKPAKYRPLLIEKLCTLAGITPPSEEARPARRRFRDDFPFLRAPDCPPELKILAADKITAHERYIQAHERLFDCTTLNECYTTAREAIERMTACRILVIGDVMLDHFIWGAVRRISPEAPVPIVEVTKETTFPGGAANVARR